MWKDVLKRDWVKVRDDAKKEGIALSRIQARKIAFKEKHDPVFTKKWSTERGKTKAEKKQIQFNNIMKRCVVNGDWEFRKYYFEPYKTQMINEMAKQQEILNNL